MPDTPSIEEVIAAIPEYAGRVVSVEPIAAGLTNRNYRVAIEDDVVFVRIPGAAPSFSRSIGPTSSTTRGPPRWPASGRGSSITSRPGTRLSWSGSRA